MAHHRLASTAGLAGALLMVACGFLPGVSALPTEIPAAAAADTVVPAAASATPAPPTATAMATPVPPTNTPMPTPDLTATSAAQATAAAAPLLAAIDGDLQDYGLSTAVGRLGWLHAPVTIELDSYMEEVARIDYPDVEASDYVLQADVTWDTTTGVAGCGLVARSGGDSERRDQYRFNVARLGPLWDVEYYRDGAFFENLTGLRDALPLDDGINSTNRLALVVQGQQLTTYANGRRLDSISDTRLQRGSAGFVAWQESGDTTCTFENGWLWILQD